MDNVNPRESLLTDFPGSPKTTKKKLKGFVIFGPAGLGGVKNSEEVLEIYSKNGIKACEIAFTYGVYIKDKKDAERIGEKAKKLGIKLSIHAPYWINLNSEDKKKIEQSKDRILECCRIGNYLGVYKVVFHPGYYGKMGREETYENIKKAIIDIQKKRKKLKYKPELAPETTGKINVFGSFDEILKLGKDTKCSFCIDFAHILAREKKVNYKEIFSRLKSFKEIHIHYSGIEYGEKGEKRHLKTSEKIWKDLLKELPKDKDFVIINESPECVQDSIEGIKIYKEMK